MVKTSFRTYWLSVRMDRLHAKQNSYKRHTFSEKYQKKIHDSSNFKTIFKRDLNRLKQEIELYPNESQIWKIQKE
jgi:hypothetical protein